MWEWNEDLREDAENSAIEARVIESEMQEQELCMTCECDHDDDSDDPAMQPCSWDNIPTSASRSILTHYSIAPVNCIKYSP